MCTSLGAQPVESNFLADKDVCHELGGEWSFPKRSVPPEGLRELVSAQQAWPGSASLEGSLSKFALLDISRVASLHNTNNTNIFQNYAMEFLTPL